MNDNSQPFVIRSPHNHILLFYIHGLMGSPLEFRRYANALAGHGSDWLEFARSNAAQWLNHVVCQLSLIRQDYDKVIHIGHSMGALLALSTTERVPVDAYVLVNGALKLRNPFCQMRWIFHMRNQPAEVLKPIMADYRSYFSINPSPIWSIPLWVKPIREVRLLVRQTTAILKEIDKPVAIFQSSLDETVHPFSAHLLGNGIGKSVVENTILDHSTHAYFSDQDFKRITNGIQRLIDHIL